MDHITTARIDQPTAPLAEAEPNQWIDRKATEQAVRAATARNTSGRRRFVDPTTCDREYTLAEREFMQAMHDYKHQERPDVPDLERGPRSAPRPRLSRNRARATRWSFLRAPARGHRLMARRSGRARGRAGR